jgi:hypothetical protein
MFSPAAIIDQFRNRMTFDGPEEFTALELLLPVVAESGSSRSLDRKLILKLVGLTVHRTKSFRRELKAAQKEWGRGRVFQSPSK